MIKQIEEDLNNMTLKEVAKKNKLTLTKLKQIIKENNLEIKYLFRTKYSNQLISAKDPFSKVLEDKRKLKKYNSYQDDTFVQRELQFCQEHIWKDNEYELGALLYEYEKIRQRLNKSIKSVQRNNWKKQLLENYDGDYVNFCLEERYGKPLKEVDDIEAILTPQILMSFIYNAYGIQKGLMVQQILGAENEA